MAYNIAFGSSNGINVDLKFGETDHFYIYRVDGQDLQFLEIRQVAPSDPSAKAPVNAAESASCGNGGSCGKRCRSAERTNKRFGNQRKLHMVAERHCADDLGQRQNEEL